MSKVQRALFASLAAVVCLPAFAWVAAELVTYYEMSSTDTATRAELGKDLGFGILLFLFVPPFALAGTAIVCWLAWTRTGRPKAGSSNLDGST